MELEIQIRRGAIQVVVDTRQRMVTHGFFVKGESVAEDPLGSKGKWRFCRFRGSFSVDILP